jgi:hypothetical protein
VPVEGVGHVAGVPVSVPGAHVHDVISVKSGDAVSLTTMPVAVSVASSFVTVTVYVAALPATTLVEPLFFVMLTTGATGVVSVVSACAVHEGPGVPLSPMQVSGDVAVAVAMLVTGPLAARSVVATIV